MPEPALPRIAVTLGEPAGIGAELVAALAQSSLQADLIAIGDAESLRIAAAARAIVLDLTPYSAARLSQRSPGALRIIDLPLLAPTTAGVLDAANAPYVIDMLARASDGCLAGEFNALVTAPVQKSIINDAGIPFSGHTEFLAERARRQVVMLLVAPGLRVALATTHLPLARVSAALSIESIINIVRIVHKDLRERFHIEQPKIAVLGLNPHAGEGGHMGREEIDVIAPAIAALRAESIDAIGPLSADTAFVPAQRGRFDAYLAMFHDQGLPILKALGFGDSVNVTLGLPFVRTSVDHGTALDLAGRGTADTSSMLAAARLALAMIGGCGSP